MKGLTSSEAEILKEHGEVNALKTPMARPFAQILKDHLLTYFNLVNVVLFLLVALTGHLVNGLFIFSVITNACIGIFQEVKARSLVQKLSLLSLSSVETMRDGKWTAVRSDELVRHDVIRLSNGMQVPCDVRVLNGSVEADESILTGETESSLKHTGDLVPGGALITSGSAEALVVHVAEENAAQKIMNEAGKYKPAKSMLNEDLQKFLRVVSIVIIPAGTALYLVQRNYLGLDWRSAVLRTVSALVGMIPEGLVILTSAALVLAVIRLSKKNILVQDMSAIEALARVDTICIDKTGTLTTGVMNVESAEPLSDQYDVNLVLGSYVRVIPDDNPTGKALHQAFRENTCYRARGYLPFSSARKYTAVSFVNKGTFYLGAPDILFPDPSAALRQKMKQAAGDGKRMLMLAHSDSEAYKAGIPDDLQPCALITLKDQLRKNVKEMVNSCRKQNIDIKVLSGDDADTVCAVAEEAGIKDADQFCSMRSAGEKDYESCTVFGRVLPEEKKEIITKLQEKGHTVAMIGDGVNDAPALKAADVGIALASGTSAAKNSANIVLLDPDFNAFDAVIMEGRRVINNITRAASMYLIKTVFSFLLMIYVFVFRKEYPFLPVHLTLISAFTVGIPTFLLQLEPDFSPVSSNFFHRALRYAVPTALTVFLLAVITASAQQTYYIPASEKNMVFLFLSAWAYLFTLHRVYSPLNQMRRIIIAGCGACLILVMILFAPWLSISLSVSELWLIIPGIVLVPAVIMVLSRLLDHIFPSGHSFRQPHMPKTQAG